MVHQTIRELDEKHSTQECSSIYSNINSEDPEFEEKKDLGGGTPSASLLHIFLLTQLEYNAEGNYIKIDLACPSHMYNQYVQVFKYI